MLVTFSSTRTGSITMFRDVAEELITMLGGSRAIPGAIGAEEIPEAINRLRERLHAAPIAGDGTGKDHNDEDDGEPQIPLTTRAAPLIDLLERAGAANVGVLWEPG